MLGEKSKWMFGWLILFSTPHKKGKTKNLKLRQNEGTEYNV